MNTTGVAETDARTQSAPAPSSTAGSNAAGRENGSDEAGASSSVRAGTVSLHARPKKDRAGHDRDEDGHLQDVSGTRLAEQRGSGRWTDSPASTPTTTLPPSSHDLEKHDEHKEPKGRHRKDWPRVPFVRRPSPGDTPWLPPHGLATNWLNLFYGASTSPSLTCIPGPVGASPASEQRSCPDLAVASVLSTFSNAHELGTPSAIPTFISYFTIIQWIWATQTYYDIRFQAEDVVHRVYKAVQVCLFVYIGAASRAWNLSKLQNPDSVAGISDNDYVQQELANESFTTVMIAFILSRALLAIQYAMSATVGKQAGRRVRFQISSMANLVVSIILTIVSLGLPATSKALVAVKIALLYLSIAIEFVMLVLQLHGSLRHHISVAAVAERYGALTLVILGEGGFNSLTRAFNYAISGLSDRSRSTYAQVFLAIGIMFMLYMFLFSWFDPEEAITEKRALAWQAIHLPLHLVILLLMAAMVVSACWSESPPDGRREGLYSPQNTVVVISYSHGLDLVATAFGQTVASITDGTLVTDRERDKIDKYLNRLNLEPDWDTQFTYLAQLVNASEPADPTVISWQYFGQIIVATTQSYGLAISDTTYDALSALYAVNTTYTTNTTLASSRQAAAAQSLGNLLAEPLSESLSGTLWLFPFAGAALIFAAARSSIWYRLSGSAHYIIHGGMALAGVALALLGLLDIGQKRIQIDLDSDNTFEQMNEVAPMYLLVDEYVPLVIVLFVYALAYFGATAAMGWLRSRHAKRAARDMDADADAANAKAKGKGTGEPAGEEKTQSMRRDKGERHLSSDTEA